MQMIKWSSFHYFSSYKGRYLNNFYLRQRIYTLVSQLECQFISSQAIDETHKLLIFLLCKLGHKISIEVLLCA